MGLPDSVHAVVRSTFGAPPFQSGNHRSLTAPTSPIAASPPNAVEIQTPSSQGTSTAGVSVVVPTPEAGLAVESSASELFVGNLKFTESRLFLFEQMLVVTEEVKLKRRVTSSDTFSQSTYQFRAAINVNKMRYESHWYNCSLPNGHTNADAAAVDQFLSTGLAPDDLRFAVLDQTPGRDVVYVIDPITSMNREAWVVQLRDIQRMQHEFLLALQDPRRFKTGTRDESWSGTRLSTDATSHSPNRPEPPAPVVSMDSSQLSIQSQTRQRKWPSFTMNRPRRLGSSSSSVAVNATVPSSTTTTVTKPGFPRPHLGSTAGPDPLLCADRPVSGGPLARSLSAERRPFLRTSNSTRFSSKLCSVPGQETGDDTDAPPFRKSSLSANSSLKITNQIGVSHCY
ncbi:Triple functional domain protein [Fasciolopsis buskii]|uniref:Triple functional domain protein n=1 Tax=Fasciolopsis buskii TaxID=27845 RepID=A0A8E0VQJ2_9TREM|nr:Triple functional domain protein [Fasciolopsis buski]